MDDETLDELAKRWCLDGIFKMGMKETAERARADAWELVVEVRRLRDHLFAVTAERDDARAVIETMRAEAALLREQLAAVTAERDEARTEVMRLDDVLVERWQKDDRGLSLRAWMEMSEDTFAAWAVSGRAWPTVTP